MLIGNIYFIFLLILTTGIWKIFNKNIELKKEGNNKNDFLESRKRNYETILQREKLDNEILTESCIELLRDIRRERRLITELDNLLQSTRRELHNTEELYRTVLRQQTPQRNDNTDNFFTVLGRISVVLNTTCGAMYVTNRFLKR